MTPANPSDTESGFKICPVCEKRTSTLYFRRVGRQDLCVLCASILEKEDGKRAQGARLRKEERDHLLKLMGLILGGCACVALIIYALYYWITHRPVKRAPVPPVAVVATPTPKPTPTPPPKPAPLVPTGTSVTISLRSDVLFDVGKAVIQPKAENALSEVAALITQVPGAKAHITGFTDNKGSEVANLTLSLRRAEAVKEWLVKKKGIEEKLVSTEGRGKKEPLAPEINPDGSDNLDGRQKNRRVTVTISRPAYAPAPATPAPAVRTLPAARR